jgi:signal transduction histidine kinase
VLGDLPAVVADQTLMHLLLGQLLSNAVKCTAGRPEPRIEVSGTADADETRFSVRDNGLGFDPAQGARLFRPFGRVHSQVDLPGTGLGLALVQRIARRHGGRAWAESTPGEGATFHVALPRTPRQIDSVARLAE